MKPEGTELARKGLLGHAEGLFDVASSSGRSFERFREFLFLEQLQSGFSRLAGCLHGLRDLGRLGGSRGQLLHRLLKVLEAAEFHDPANAGLRRLAP